MPDSDRWSVGLCLQPSKQKAPVQALFAFGAGRCTEETAKLCNSVVPLRGLCRAAPSVEPARPAPTTAMPRSAVPSPKVTTKMSNFGSLVDAGALLR